MARLPTLLLFVLLCGCDPQDPEPPAPPPQPKLGPVPELSLPEIEESQTLELDAPAAPPRLRWKFPERAEYGYAIDQDTIFLDRAAKGSQKSLKTGGLVAVKTSEPGKALAKFVLWNKEPKDGKPDKPQELDYAIREDGAVYPVTTAAAQAQGLQLDVLLALPDRPLAPGGSVASEISVDGIPNRLAQKGKRKITLTGYAKIERYACARLESEVEIELVATPETGMVGGGRMKGRVVAYFAYEEGFFVQIDAAARLATRAATKPSGTPGENVQVLLTDLDTRVHIRKK